MTNEELNKLLNALLLELTGMGVDFETPELCGIALELGLNNARANRRFASENIASPATRFIDELEDMLKEYRNDK